MFSVRYSRLYQLYYQKNTKHDLPTLQFIFTSPELIKQLVLKKDEYRLELQTPEATKLFGKTNKINRQNKEWRKCSLEMFEVALVQCNLIDNQYQ